MTTRITGKRYFNEQGRETTVQVNITLDILKPPHNGVAEIQLGPESPMKIYESSIGIGYVAHIAPGEEIEIFVDGQKRKEHNGYFRGETTLQAWGVGSPRGNISAVWYPSSRERR